jgi:hypothetical protein
MKGDCTGEGPETATETARAWQEWREEQARKRGEPSAQDVLEGIRLIVSDDFGGDAAGEIEALRLLLKKDIEAATIPQTDMTGRPFEWTQEHDDILTKVRGIMAEVAPPTPQSLLTELEDARRKLRAVESVLLSLVLQEFDSDPRRMARAILDYRLEARNA